MISPDWLSSPSRQRMLVIACAAVFFGFFTQAMDVLLPLWVTGELGFTGGQWAYLRSLRFAGALVGTLILGALSDRFGAKLVGCLCMLSGGALMVALAFGKAAALWIGMAFIGAVMSTAFVNVNTLTQYVSTRRQGLANTVYRSVNAAMGIAAPLAVTCLGAWMAGYSPVLLVLAVTPLAASLILWRFPEAPPPPFGNLKDEFAALLRTYARAMHERPLMRLVHTLQIWGTAIAVPGAFGAIRLTRELGQSDTSFGAVSAIAGVGALVATAATALFIDRVNIRKMFGVLAMASSLIVMAVGYTDSILLTSIGYIAVVSIVTMLIVPMSMWISRLAGGAGQNAAFSVHKIFSVLYMAVGMVLMGLVERHIGIENLFVAGGAISAVAALFMFRVPEPSDNSTMPGRAAV